MRGGLEIYHCFADSIFLSNRSILWGGWESLNLPFFPDIINAWTLKEKVFFVIFQVLSFREIYHDTNENLWRNNYKLKLQLQISNFLHQFKYCDGDFLSLDSNTDYK